MDIYLVRHAESLANTQGIYQGQTYDTDLSETGKQQAQALAKALSNLSINQIYTSPAQRALQTGLSICQTLLIGEPVIDGRLEEINHGDWEGKTTQEIQDKFPLDIHAWKTEPQSFTMPQGENLHQVWERAYDFLSQVSQSDYQRVVVVTHDAVIRTILTKLLLRELNDIWIYQLDSAGYSVIEWNGKFNQVIKINENQHLNGLASDLSTHAL